MTDIKVSIIVPCYKVEEYLPRCLDSLVNQTLDGVEAICINDGSPDNSLKILKEYKKKYGDKIVIIDKKNEGVWRGRKDGVKVAKGEFIGFVDSDDYVALNHCEKLYKAAVKNNADISVCGFDRIDLLTGKLYSREMCKSNKKVIDMKKNPGDLLELNGAPWNKLYRSSIVKEAVDLQRPPKILDDMMFLLLIYINTKKIVFVNDSLVYYMVRSDSIINNIKAEHLESTYDAMVQVRKVYENSENRVNMLPVLDAEAFLHLGISLMYRMSNDKKCNLKEIIGYNTQFLDNYFPTWRHSKYIKLSYVIENHGVNLKLWFVRQFYRFGLFRAFLAVYRFMILKLKFDIKW